MIRTLARLVSSDRLSSEKVMVKLCSKNFQNGTSIFTLIKSRKTSCIAYVNVVPSQILDIAIFEGQINKIAIDFPKLINEMSYSVMNTQTNRVLNEERRYSIIGVSTLIRTR